MARLKTERIVIREEDKRSSDVALDFKLDIHVSQDRLFTCNLPTDIVDKLEHAGVSLTRNPKIQRTGKPGFFSALTLPDLIDKVKTTCEEYVSKTLIEEKLVVRYNIQTCCTYVREGSEFFPNGRFTKYFQELGFTEGTKSCNATWPAPYGFHIYTEVKKKLTYRYASGATKTFYEPVHDSSDNSFALNWLSGVVGNKNDGAVLQEIDYTEDVAEFFIGIYKSLFRINEQIKGMTSPEAIEHLITNKQKLLV